MAALRLRAATRRIDTNGGDGRRQVRQARAARRKTDSSALALSGKID
jgi:hypothetical protein